MILLRVRGKGKGANEELTDDAILFTFQRDKADNKTVSEAFRQRLNKVAGFKYVPAPMPMRNEQGALVYYLYFASPNKTGASIVSDIFKKYREKGLR